MESILKKYVGLLGGSFDPAHKGHLGISKIALKKLKLKKVYWVITEKNPFKSKPFYSLKDRIKYAKKVTKTQKKIKIIYLDDIIKSSRIIDAINYLIKKKKIKNIVFMIGSDNLIKFHKWKNWKKIVKLTKLVVFSRKGYDKKSRESIVVKHLNKNNITFIKIKPIIISSTILKKKIKLSIK